ncbi:helix-turn-helix domain-containing protein [Pedobacter sp.]
MGKEWEDRLADNEIKSFFILMMNDLKKEILTEIKQVVTQGQIPNIQKWIKSVEVKKLLNVSHGKLQTMRNSKTISFTRIGGTIYYNMEEIEKMMQGGGNRR